jgi:hypothetical protein
VPGGNDSEPPKIGLLKDLLHNGDFALDPRSLEESGTVDKCDQLVFSRFVVVGGPGSGKSTLGQFLAQIHRAAWLDSLPAAQVEAETREIVAEVQQHCEQSNFPRPHSIRIPFRVELSRFARSLASSEGNVKSLADYLLKQFCPSEPPPVRVFTRWLFRFPALLILDGLDEVPASSNRPELCNAIRDFLVEATRNNANLLVHASTRPEGYNDEFGGLSYSIRHVAPLTTDQALAYAKLLASVRLTTDEQRVTEILEMLTEAAEHRLTARLMQTPLQVTFLTTLVAAGGQPPRDRWKLFHDYYATIYKREQQKCEGNVRKVLDEQAALIDSLHHDVGYVLHVQGEQTGQTDAEMALSEFETRVDQRLSDDEWEGVQRDELRQQIVETARTRLVFLTSRVEHKLSFDVRSLQEFMACERITSSSDELLKRRLEAIVQSSHWRNVFLFIAGKYFATSQADHLCPLIYEICENLNDELENRDAAAVMLGSQIAIDLLEDGTVSRTPRWARKFRSLALKSLKLPPDDPVRTMSESTNRPRRERLLAFYALEHRSLYEQAITERISHSDPQEELAAWQLLVDLIGVGCEWAIALADSVWPTEPEQQFALLSSTAQGHLDSDWVVARLLETVPAVSPVTVCNAHDLFDGQTLENDCHLPDWLRSSLSLKGRDHLGRNHSDEAEIRDSGGQRTGVGFNYHRASGGASDWRFLTKLAAIPEPRNIHWELLISAGKFSQNPTEENLAIELERLAPKFVSDCRLDKFHSTWMPWQFACCVRNDFSNFSLLDLAEAARNGELGNRDAWENAEDRWNESGLCHADVSVSDRFGFGFDKEVSAIGFPWIACRGFTLTGGRNSQASCELLEEYFDLAIGPAKESIGEMYNFNLSSDRFTAHPPFPNIESFRKMVVERIDGKQLRLDTLALLKSMEGLDEAWLSELHRAGETAKGSFPYTDSEFSDELSQSLSDAYVTCPERHGLLPIIHHLDVDP